MKFFQRSNKKPLTPSEKIILAYNGYKSELVTLFFPGGTEQAGRVILSLARLYGTDLEAVDEKVYHEILTTYSDVIIRTIVTPCSPAHIMVSLQINHPELITTPETARKALAYVMLNKEDNSFELVTDEDMRTLTLVSDSLARDEQLVRDNAVAEKLYLDDPEYGLAPEKPVYTRSTLGADRFLAALKTAKGEPLTWKHLGSVVVECVNGMVDVYEAHLPNGSAYQKVYINTYGSKNPETTPKGFKR